MSREIAIRVENLAKSYKLYDSPLDRLKEVVHPLRRKYHHDFQALDGISFEVKKGDTVGIIGKNGSGKSTLLKLIAGVLTPTAGRVSVNGRVSALLELGAGFNPELTGIENIYFSGALMGLTRREMNARMPAILSFADIGEFVHQPVKSYSSGMFVRLAFAVAVSVEPEILIVDEALSVGDMQFQKKCMDKMNEFRKNGKTILFVSHNLYAIRVFCRSAILLRRGKIVTAGHPDQVADCYLRERDAEELPADPSGLDQRAVRTHRTDIVTIVSVRLLDHAGGARNSFSTHDPLQIEIRYRASSRVPRPTFGMAIFYQDADTPFRVCTSNSKWTNSSPGCVDGEGVVRFTIDSLLLLPARYSICLAIKDEHDLVTFDRIEDAVFFNVVGENGSAGILRECGIVFQPGRWQVEAAGGGGSP